jgi:acyl-CoA reductase-like NAD-dependent aldehyde dehydrogenase
MSAVEVHKKVFDSINPPTKLFINNEFVDAADGSTFPVIDPSTEEVFCNVSHAKLADVNKAVDAAKNAFPAWSAMPALQRSQIMFKLADLIDQHKENLGKLESLNHGKAVPAARDYDIWQVVNIFRYYAGWCDKLPLGEVVPGDNDFSIVVTRQPCGIVGAIVPWNFPLMLTTWKIAPALAVGCCVVLKPSELTPLTGL